MSTLAWHVAIGMGSFIIPFTGNAQIIADGNAPKAHQPQILLTTGNIPQVDIQTPSAAGVSLNEYRQFDVAAEGAILNNARKAAPTHIGGMTSANPNLLKGEAAVIINQINSSDPSYLHGQLEVAGKRADVIMANPAGISVNGGSIINAGKAILTTGTPKIDQNGFQGVDVERGKITIGEQGLSVANSDYAAIIAREAEINGPIQAGEKALDVLVGSQSVSADGTVQATKSSDRSETRGLDTGKLGGMYSGSIRLISNDKGVGVNHQGVASAQKIVISADGKLVNAGKIQANSVDIQAHAMDNRGELTHGGETLAIHTGKVTNAGTIGPIGQTSKSGNMPAKNEKGQAGSGRIALQDELVNQGSIASSTVHLDARQGLDNRGQMQLGKLIVRDGRIDNPGHIHAATGELNVSQMDNSGTFTAGSLALIGDALNNPGSMVLGSGDLTVKQVNNSGILNGGQQLRIRGNTLRNEGTLSANALQLSGDQLFNAGNIFGLDGAMQMRAQNLDNSGTIGHDQDSNDASLAGSSGKPAVPSGSSSASASPSSLDYAVISNSGKITAAGGVSTDVKGELQNRGALNLNTLSFEGDTLNNRDGHIHADRANISARHVDNENGTLSAGEFTGLDLTALNNKNGTLFSGNDLRFQVAHFENNTTSSIGSGKDLSISATSIDNQGRLFAGNVLELQAQRLNNGGHLQGKSLAVDVLALHNQGKIEQTGTGTLTVKAAHLHNQEQGKIGKTTDTANAAHTPPVAGPARTAGDQDGHIRSQGAMDNSGDIAAQGKIRLESGQSLANHGAIRVDELQVNLPQLENRGVLQAQAAWLNGKTLSNHGQLTAHTFHKFAFDDKVDNHGQIFAQSNLQIESPHIRNHQNAFLGSATTLTFSDQWLDNTGTVVATKILFEQGQLDNRGVIAGQQTFEFANAAVRNAKEATLQGNKIGIAGGALTNHGQVVGKNDLVLDLDKMDNHGILFSAGSLQLMGKQWHNHGLMHAEGKATLNGNTGHNHGTLNAATLDLQAETLVNHGLVWQRQGDLTLSSDHLINHGNIGVVAAGTPQSGPSASPPLSTAGADGQIRTVTLENHGDITAANIHLDQPKTLDNRGTLAISRFDFTGDHLQNRGHLIAKELRLEGNQLTNHKGASFSAGHIATFRFDETVNHGIIASDRSWTLQTRHLSSLGPDSLIAGKEGLRINANEIHQQGQIQSGGVLEIAAANLFRQEGSVVGAENIRITTPEWITGKNAQTLSRGNIDLNIARKTVQEGLVATSELLRLVSPLLHNTGIMRGRDTHIALDESLNNQGTIAADNNQRIITPDIVNSGTLAAGKKQQLDQQRLENSGAVIANVHHLDVETLHNSGTISQTGGAALSIEATDILGKSGSRISENRVASSGAATPTLPGVTQQGHLRVAETLENSGAITAGGTITVHATNSLDNDGEMRVSRLLLEGERAVAGQNSDIDATQTILRTAHTDIGGRFTGQSLDLQMEQYTNRAVLRFDNVNWSRLKALDNYGHIDTAHSIDWRMERLNNAAGTLRTPGTFSFTGTTLQNGGKILSAGAQTIDVTHFDNSGVMATLGKHTLRAETSHNRAGGEINAAQLDWQLPRLANDGLVFLTGASALHINAPRIVSKGIIGQSDVILPNQARTLSLQQAGGQSSATSPQTPDASHITVAEELHIGNTQGGIISNHSVTLHTQELDNSGKMQLADARVEGKGFTNTGSINADTLTVLTDQPENHGTIIAGNLTLRAQTLNNTGTLASENAYSLDIAERIDNRGNILSANTLTLNTPVLNSTGGRISAIDTILNLRERLQNGGQILGRNLTLNTPHIQNSGTIYGEQSYHVKVDTLTNSGTLSSAGDLEIAALNRVLHLHNSGQILAVNTVVTADSIGGGGLISAARNAQVQTASVYGQGFTAGNQLDLNVQGSFRNSGVTGAGNRANIRAASIDNPGRLLAGQHLNITTGSFDNSGLVNSSGTTAIDASYIHNSGRLYGDYVRLNAQNLSNDGVGAIAARRSLDINASRITNIRQGKDRFAPIIKSDGHMSLSGDSLMNSGGIIQAAGDIHLYGLRARNENPYFSLRKESHAEYGRRFIKGLDDDATGELYPREWFDYDRDLFYSKDVNKTNGKHSFNAVSEIFASVETKRDVVDSSTPGQILAGGNITLNRSSIVNDKSQIIAGGVIYAGEHDIQNLDAEGEEQVFYDGTYHNTIRRKNSRIQRLKRGKYDRVDFGSRPRDTYKDSGPIVRSPLNIALVQEHQTPHLAGHHAYASSDPGARSDWHRLESGNYATLNQVEQLFASEALFQVTDGANGYLVQTDPDYIGGVVPHIPAYRPATPIAGHHTPSSPAAVPDVTEPKRPDNSQTALALVEANFADKLTNRLGRIEEHLGQYIRPTDAPQAVSFGVDHDKIAALAPYTPDTLQQLPHIEDLLGKRLGDLYYEQEIVRRQLALLTGRNRLPGHADGIEQYKTLLASGAEYLKRFGLSPGVALNAEQMANLTTDVVILVNRTVTLADGTTREVAMPQLYVHKRAGDTDGRRTLIAGEGITGQAGKVQNSAVLHAREYNTLQASHVDNTGRITARDQHLSSTGDIHNIGGLIQGSRSVNVRAGGKVVNDSTTESHSSKHPYFGNSWTRIGKEGRIILDGQGLESIEDQMNGSLRVYAGGDVIASAATFENHNQGSLTYISGANLKFGTQTSSKEQRVGLALEDKPFIFPYPTRDNLRDRRVQWDQGVSIKGKGEIILEARQGKIEGKALNVDSESGHVGLYGRDGVDLENGWRKYDNTENKVLVTRKFARRKETQDYQHEIGEMAEASSITGKTVEIIAGRDASGENTNASADLNVTGSHIVSDHGTHLGASRNIHIKAAEETYWHDQRNYSHRAGFSAALPGYIHIGGKEKENNTVTQGKTYAPTLVGALDGNVIINAGNHYQQDGSIVHASRKENLGTVASKAELAAMSDAEREAYWEKRSHAGNVIIHAKSAQINALVADHDSTNRRKDFIVGINLGIQGGMFGSAQSTYNSALGIRDGSNARVKAMGAANTAWNAYQTGRQSQNGSGGSNGAITMGFQKTVTDSKSQWQSLTPSQISADGTVLVQLAGKGVESTLNVVGSDLGGAERTILDVEGKKTFQSVLLEQNHRSDTRTFGGYGGTNGGSLLIGGNAGHGYYRGEQGVHRLAHVGTLTGHTDLGEGKTTVIGAQIFGKSVSGITEDLLIASPQGTGNERGKYTSGSFEVGFGSGNMDASGSFSHSEMQGSHQSVNAQSGGRDAAQGLSSSSRHGKQLLEHIEKNDLAYNRTHAHLSGQSGIYAGDDGYQIINRGETTLKGGIITSTQRAESSGQNLFITDTLKLEDVENRSRYHGFGIKLSASTSTDSDKDSSFNVGDTLERERENGTTHASINTRNLVILDTTGQEALTGKHVTKTLSQANRGIWTDNAAAHSGAVNSQLKSEAGLQQLMRDADIAHQFDQTRQQVGNDIRQRQDQLKAQYESGQISEREYHEQQQTLQNVSLVLESISAGLSANGGVAGMAAAALSPTMANTIGQYYKELAAQNPDGKLTPAQKAEQALTHSLLAGVVAKANGGNALSTALSAGSAEFAASIVSQALYGTSDPQNLDSRQKANLLNIMRGLGAVTGAFEGKEEVGAGTQAAQNAVNNNQLMHPSELFGINETGRATLAGAQEVFEETFKQSLKKSGNVADAMEEATKAAQDYVSCAGCTTSLQRSLEFISYMLMNGALDFTPVIGDIKGFVEAQSAGDYFFATIGLIPAVGDGIKQIHAASKAYDTAKAVGNVEGMKAAMQQANNAVRSLDVDTYKNLKDRSVKGDNLEHDHIPSFAAIKKAKEEEINRILSPLEERELYNNSIAIEIPKEIHREGRTFGGKNTVDQITKDARDLCKAQNCDLEHHRENLIKRGFSNEEINKAFDKVKYLNNKLGIGD